GHEAVIVEPEARVRLPDGQIGEIWVQGPSVASGYWNRPEETTRSFQARLEGAPGGPFLRTGDLGFLIEGQLFVAGRLKDLIIIRGRNVHPEDVEAVAAGAHPAIRAGSVVAFGVEHDGEEAVAIVAEAVEAAEAGKPI